ncbi:MAG: twin-arginine translocase subunit TatC [Dehalococcoidia bacterium]|nr:twin-arginine translocase subunit TatC [Dehalococcoidia bacterium]
MVAVAKEKPDKEKRLTFLGHLQEIRRRLVYCVLALIVTVAVSFFLTDRIIEFLESYVPQDVDIIFTEVTEMFAVWFKVCLYAALVMALPFFVLQLILFIRPALTRKERAYLYLLMPAILLCFAGGAAFAWYVFMPHALEFLLGFGSHLAEPQIKVGSLISFEVQIIFWMGVVFELPVIAFFLAKIGILDYRWLARQWRWGVVGAVVAAAIITPTPDPINCLIVAAPICLLYLLSILAAWIARPGKKATA